MAWVVALAELFKGRLGGQCAGVEHHLLAPFVRQLPLNCTAQHVLTVLLQVAAAREALPAHISVVCIPQDDAWFRDTGPTVRGAACCLQSCE